MRFFKIIALWSGLVLMTALSLWYFQGLWVAPNGFLGVNGDGYKNYATVEYHVKNDAQYHHFEGMNYPYGDHIAFADAQPILANGIKFFCRHVMDVSSHTRAILHTFLLLSFWLCYLFIYLIFRRLGQKKDYASLAAVAITWLSPQLARWEEHYALGYVFVIPMLLYLLLRHSENKAWKFSFFITIFTVFVAQIHLYYLAIVVLFLSFYHFFDFLKKDVKKVETIAHFLLQAILPACFITFYWLKIDNNITDRPAVPGGFLTYRALWQGLFDAPNSFIFNILQWKPPYIFAPMENIVYLGIAVILLPFIFFKKIAETIHTMRRTKKILVPKTPLSLFLLAALPLFLLSLGLPFVISDWEKYLSLTGGLQQFRGVGRFAWVFFYVVNIVGFVSVGNYFFAQKNIYKRYLPYFLVGFSLLDAAYLHRKPIVVLPVDFFKKDIQVFDNQKNIDWKKYQAILPLPYFHVGSEQFDISAEGFTLPYTFYFSIEKNLPSIGSQGSRTSFEQSYLLQRFATTQNNHKPLYINDLLNQKPVLILQNKKAFVKDTLYTSWNNFEVKYLCENDVLRFYETSFQEKTAFTPFEKNNFEAPKMFLHNENIIFKGHLDGQKAHQKHQVSFRWLCEQSPQPLLEYHIRELDPTTGAQLQLVHYGCRYFRKNMSDDHFVSCELPFETWFENSLIEVTLFYTKAPQNVPLIIDDFKIF
jgi:hypothetical protein